MSDAAIIDERPPTGLATAPVPLQYLAGFGNELASEALPGALPVGRNSPQQPAYGLYAEQLTGTSFTAPRAENRRSWLYRIRPSVMHGAFRRIDAGALRSAPIGESEPTPNRFRWDALPIPAAPTDFVAGLVTMAANGDAEARAGAAIHVYACNSTMNGRVFANSDGELLLVPQQGRLRLRTEFGLLDVAPGEIAVVPRAVRFAVEPDGPARGFACENYGAHFRLPELGPIGSNGLANARDFQSPVAAYEDSDAPVEIVVKFGGGLWACDCPHSPFDVVAWHGNCLPYKFDLARFNAINTVTWDHPDPSINTVLTSPSGMPGIANVELAAFVPRWDVAEDTFRPPFYHRNVMCEFGALIRGQAEARVVVPGSCTLHNSMAAHGPDPSVFKGASMAENRPRRLEGLAVLFETRLPLRPTRAALASPVLQRNYDRNWDALPKRFKVE